MKRIAGLDDLRGFAILGVVFVHSTVFSFAGIDRLDMEHPPLSVAIMGLAALFGGVFTVISGAVNTVQACRRVEQDGRAARHALAGLVLSGVFLVAAHYFYTFLLGPTSFDFETHHHHYSLLPALIRGIRLDSLDLTRLFENTTLSLLGWSLVFNGVVLWLLLRRGGLGKRRRNCAIMTALGLLFMLGGLLRIQLFPVWEQALQSRRFFSAAILGFIAARSYPLLPYLGFGFFGSLLGLQLAGGMGRKTINATLFGAGAAWLASGVTGYILSPPVVGRVDFPWFFKVNIELGLFLLVSAVALNLTRFSWREAGQETSGLRSPLRTFGMLSLSVFLLQTPVTEILAWFLRMAFPGWDQEIGRMFLFGGLNLLAWLLFVFLVQKGAAPWPAERLRAAYFRLVGRETSMRGVTGGMSAPASR
jgi:peptidoglycan/LPS O-acetylase OafA/YrhL